MSGPDLSPEYNIRWLFFLLQYKISFMKKLFHVPEIFHQAHHQGKKEIVADF
jgi:hypothetical protein